MTLTVRQLSWHLRVFDPQDGDWRFVSKEVETAGAGGLPQRVGAALVIIQRLGCRVFQNTNFTHRGSQPLDTSKHQLLRARPSPRSPFPVA